MSEAPSTQQPQRTLDARYYTDPAVYEQECNGLLAQTWQFAAHESQLANAGDYVTFAIAGENLFCVRTADGELRAFYNVCQHRAHQLLSDAGNTRTIVCPYHAWSYELTGELRNGPNLRSVTGFDKSSVCLTGVRVEVLCGFVFVNLDPDAQPMDHWFPGVRAELSAFVPQLDRLKPVKWVEIPERCNWKVSIENYSECYHCELNHPTFSRGVVKPSTYDIQAQGHCLRHTTECQNLDRMSYPINLDSNDYAGQYSSWFLWPLFSFQVYPGNVLNTYHWRILEHDKIVVWRGWYAEEDTDIDWVLKLAEQDRETTVEEDIHLVESVQRGLRSRGYRPGPLVVDPAGGVRSEHSLQVLHGWVRDAVD